MSTPVLIINGCTHWASGMKGGTAGGWDAPWNMVSVCVGAFLVLLL
jgi:hypothetical protein